ncbi:MAG TPA: hypothetical protein DEG17_21975 [Cyanobacteria bacterium UBA11149]|nr:hypothetical protein [Cyanobacteria bacterium UBA11367]HBE57083.1 hypothetical protein [Cyanobacteria bacterium UBA11366]HBR74460.1 hypothetical protein [Cyanobacteria bacterium UBA11159]HBS70046.1 hypothetical protein [Cyanobacteria bacterium UBA11153]HBW91452.1 hypothetical protein [Cyanobacteria bacterium UBA11149]HCA97000.1 hypothetical protein [Cyanobacteria bacterium UBA9226]
MEGKANKNDMLLSFYLLISICLFGIWFERYNQERNLSREEKIFCLVTFVIGAVVWPIVLPIAYGKLLNNSK